MGKGKGKTEKSFRYIMMHKPAGAVTATQDRGQGTVMDFLPISMPPKGLFPVGRLDKDSTGLLILTDDGDYCHRVTHPKRQIAKRYEVLCEDAVTAEDVAAFAAGVPLRDGTLCLPAKLELDEGDARHCFVEIVEGKYHQVKRMFGARGNRVQRLRRLSIGALVLDDALKKGMSREMTKEEAELVFIVGIRE